MAVSAKLLSPSYFFDSQSDNFELKFDYPAILQYGGVSAQSLN